MSWVLFSILSAVLLAIATIIDKYVLDKWVKKPIVPIIVLSSIGLIAGIVTFLIKGFQFLPIKFLILLFIAGVFGVMAVLFYFKALKIEEASKIAPLFYVSPLFIAILAAIFLGEIFTPMKYAGIFLIVIGAFLISFKNIKKFHFGKGALFIIIGSFLFSINMIITKYTLNFYDYWTIFGYQKFIGFIVAIPLIIIGFKYLISTIKTNGEKALAFMSLSEIITVISTFLVTMASAIGFVTLVGVISEVTPFFVFIFTLLLSLFLPRILKEEFGKKSIIIKVISLVLMFAGVILVAT
ncbi:hypothetical protein AUJ10_01805 [Candidatus Pacearchaeota archaeon CG1_02_31_27]|nr:MAG: hypothetical protein AUJ10_01805 [Candidatus Pacearchaeota archaeon CG1_02_31_27]PIZ80722.1 MAG: hypothetical protein COX99_01815 [Candidatus Pacearchaeota archaeon CG_4_10_14_0_2_um_filter_31_10]